VFVSNCVLNLVPDKQKAFAEIYRVLRPGGHFSISDIVLDGQLPPELAKAAELYVGCVAGALQRSEYLGIIDQAGFEGIVTHKEKPITVPETLIENILGPEETANFMHGGVGISSVTVGGVKPSRI